MSSSEYPAEDQLVIATPGENEEVREEVEAEGEAPVHENGTPVSDEVAIKFDHVTKTYKLYKDDKQRFASIFWGKKKRKLVTSVNANNNLSFEIKRGEAVAFLGENGAGKSTALKMVTGVAYPTKGKVTVNGHVSALLELTAGFDKALTGRENVRLRGKAMGFTDEQLEELIPKTIEFADLGVYIDQPVRMYSSGMKSRLGFGLAVSSDPEILVVDEALAVGDKRFKEKCYARVREIMEDENVTVLFVTHSSGAAEEFCKRGIVLEKGSKMFDGPIDEAVAFYEGMN
ncbi:ABC transporter ATP-binding protein [uncultured Adlercreutzia sp.]|uniref:ABC transporter ATP-binding protein n=1 Tax=uncultured Adlercreutzia sp. TaxID=875803 RepID=UPI0025DEE9FF|nr:ABC transporter ATP-binding protein [uncultured Adlercreutzia sp.]MCI9262901.1 ABC transporter ATP-binding protein [Eggerthellaceae bacterium]